MTLPFFRRALNGSVGDYSLHALAGLKKNATQALVGSLLFAVTMNGTVSIEESPDVVRAMVSGNPVLVYQKERLEPPGELDPIYAGSGFIHPLHTPSGLVLTTAFPVDHAHQHGVFSAWARATFNHESIDFWNKHKGTGYFEHVAVKKTSENGFVISRRQVSRTAGPAINETWKISIEDRADLFIVDVVQEQQPATTREILLHRYHYGGFAFRGNDRWNKAAGDAFEGEMKILTGNGTTDLRTANMERPRWVCAYGKSGERAGGVVIMDHPMNFRYPQPVRVHPQMPYFTFAPVAEGPFILAPGFIYKARYRLITFDGEPDSRQIETMYNEYIQDVSTPED